MNAIEYLSQLIQGQTGSQENTAFLKKIQSGLNTTTSLNGKQRELLTGAINEALTKGRSNLSAIAIATFANSCH